MVLIPLWIIAIVEIIRMIQNFGALYLSRKQTDKSDSAYDEFIKHLKQSDKEFIHNLLKEFENEISD